MKIKNISKCSLVTMVGLHCSRQDIKVSSVLTLVVLNIMGM